MEPIKQTCQFCKEEKENYYSGFVAMILPNDEMEAKIDKWGRENWWENLQRTDLTEEEYKELNDLASYDQALNTIERGVMCEDCMKKEDELYAKYYPNII